MSPRAEIRQPMRLEALPNIGPAIAADLRRIGIDDAEQLLARDPLMTFHELAGVMGKRHDPCVLYTLLAVQDYLRGAPASPWWKFTAEGKALLEMVKPTVRVD